MMTMQQLMLICSVYPLVLVMGYYYFLWFKRAKKLILVENDYTTQFVLLQMGSTRMFALFFWAAVELAGSIYTFIKYYNDGFEPLL